MKCTKRKPHRRKYLGQLEDFFYSSSFSSSSFSSSSFSKKTQFLKLLKDFLGLLKSQLEHQKFGLN